MGFELRQPAVFNRMAEEMLFLANQGVEVLRLDAVTFIWKQPGTNCENLPQAHTLIKAFNLVARIAAPALLFKSEAIVHPDEVETIPTDNEHVLAFMRAHTGKRAVIFANFSESPQTVARRVIEKYSITSLKELHGRNHVSPKNSLVLEPLDFVVLG